MKLFFRSFGNGPPIFILHGLYGSSDNWLSIGRMIGVNYKVYLPDLRNHGQSPHSDLMNYEVMSEDLLELVNSLNIRKFYLAGHSMGGKVAISFALKWPDRINGLLIADISPFINERSGQKVLMQHSSILKAVLSLDLLKIKSRMEAEAELKKMIEPDNVRGFILKNLQRNSDKTFSWKLDAKSLLNNIDRIMEGIDRRLIDNYQISGFPVIFLKGAKSDYIDPSDYPYILRIFPAAEIKEIANAGHWLHSDQPEEIAKNLNMLSGSD